MSIAFAAKRQMMITRCHLTPMWLGQGQLGDSWGVHVSRSQIVRLFANQLVA